MNIEALRYVILAVSLLSMVLAVLWMRNNRRYRWVMLAPLTVVAHVTIYHICRVCSLPIPTATLNLWSATIHLHIVLLYLVGLIIFWKVDDD